MNNDPQTQTNEQKVKKAIENHHYQKMHLLNLHGKNDIWMDVLTYQDWTSLVEVCLSKCCINDEGVEFLVGMAWPNLEVLWLGNNEITNKGVEKFICNQWPKLAVLMFYYNKITIKGVQIFLQHKFPNCSNFYSEDHENRTGSLLSINRALLNGSNNFQTLLMLKLSGYYFGTKQMRLLVSINCPFLSLLFLDSCTITNQTIKSLTKSNWKNLEQISLKQNLIGFDGIHSLYLSNWTKLKSIWLTSRIYTSFNPQYQIILDSIGKMHILAINRSNLTITEVHCDLSKFKIQQKRIEKQFENKFSIPDDE